MSDLDTLILMFQTQLSDVMETVLKTAMHEVTRLVENGFVEEVRRRNQDVETLRTQLQWAEKKLSNADEGETVRQNVRCVDCGKAVCSEETSEPAEESGTELQYGVLTGCGMKQEDDAMELCTRSHGQEVVSELAQEADMPVLILSPVRESVTTEQDNVRPVVDVKKEEVNEPSCSAEHPGDWAVSHDGGVGSEPHSMSEWTAAQPEQTQQSSEELLRTIMRQDPQTPITHTCTEDQEETRTLYTCMVTEPSEISPFEIDSTQVTSTLRPTGLTLSHTHEIGNNCETAMTRVTPKQMGHNATAPISAQVGRDHISSSDSPRARQHFSDMGTVVIKEEIIVNSDEGEEMEEKQMMRPGMAPSFTVNQYMGGPEVHQQDNISHKPIVKEIMKLHSKVGSSTMLKATVQHHQTIKKPTHSLASNTSRTVSSDVHSQVASLNLHHRTPTTSKGLPSLLSLQRAQEPKRPLTLTRTSSIPWVSIKTHQQSANSQHLHTHSGSHSHSHLLRCSQCGKCFPHPSNLKAHLQTHTGERPFCCSLCGRSFTKLSNLKAHRRVHTGERPYCCLACGKRFTQKCNLKRHQRIHLE